MKVVEFAGKTCDRIQRLLHSYVNNELSVETTHEVLKHLESCEDCTAELQQLSRLRTLVQGAVRAQTASPVMRERIREHLDRGVARPAVSLRGWSFAAASVALTLIAGTLVYRGSFRETPLPDDAAQDRFSASVEAQLVPVIQTGMRDHIHCALFRKYPPTPISNEQMVADMGPFSPLISLIRAKVPVRYRIEQAHRCTVKGRRYVHLIFRDNTALISVIMAEKRDGEAISESLTAAHAGKFQAAAFESGKYVAWIISDLSAGANLELARAVQPVITAFLAGFQV